MNKKGKIKKKIEDDNKYNFRRAKETTEMLELIGGEWWMGCGWMNGGWMYSRWRMDG